MLGGLIRPGISMSASELAALASVSFEPSLFDRLLLRAMALGVLITIALAALLAGAFVWALLFH